MSEHTLLRHRKVLTRTNVSPGPGLVGFGDPDAPDRRGLLPAVMYTMPEHYWRDMGCPEEITLSVVPGDRLNDSED